MFYKKGGGDIWSILTLNNIFFFGENGKNARRGGGVHLFPQHNFNLSPKMVIFWWRRPGCPGVRPSGRPVVRPSGPAVRRAVRTVRRAEHSSRVQHSSRTVFIPTYIYRCDIIPPWLGKEHSIRVQHPSRTVFIPTYIYGCDIIPLWLGKEHSNCVRHANHSQALST